MFVLMLLFTLHEGGDLRFFSSIFSGDYSLYSVCAMSWIFFCDCFLYNFVTRFLPGGLRLHQETTKGFSLKIKPSQDHWHSGKGDSCTSSSRWDFAISRRPRVSVRINNSISNHVLLTRCYIYLKTTSIS